MRLQVRDQFFAGYFARALELAQQLPLLTSDIDRTELFSLVLRSRACLDRSRSETPSPSHVDPATVATVNAIDFWHHVCFSRLSHCIRLSRVPGMYAERFSVFFHDSCACSF